MQTLFWFLAGAFASVSSAQDWNYSDISKWDDDFVYCGGESVGGHANYQSPINLDLPPSPAPTYDLALSFLPAGDDCMLAKFGANDHAIQVDFDNDCVRPRLEFESKEYTLAQFHFHATSEHTFNDLRTSAEVHLVHTRTNDQGNAEYLVVGVMLDAEENSERGAPSAFLDILLQGDFGHRNQDFPPGRDIYSYVVPQNGTFVAFEGSLTTPPCTPGVQWIMFEDIVQIDQAHVDKMKALWGHGRSDGIKSTADAANQNFRPVQPVKDRAFSYGIATLPSVGSFEGSRASHLGQKQGDEL